MTGDLLVMLAAAKLDDLELFAPAMILGVVCGLRSGIEGVALGLSAALVLVAVPMIAAG